MDALESQINADRKPRIQPQINADTRRFRKSKSHIQPRKHTDQTEEMHWPRNHTEAHGNDRKQKNKLTNEIGSDLSFRLCFPCDSVAALSVIHIPCVSVCFRGQCVLGFGFGFICVHLCLSVAQSVLTAFIWVYLRLNRYWQRAALRHQPLGRSIEPFAQHGRDALGRPAVP